MISQNGRRRRRQPKPPKQVNRTVCGKCGAKSGETCFILTGRRFIELDETHFPQPKSGIRSAPPTAEELAARKRSTPVLDARLAERDQRIAKSRRRVNGGI